jgi:divalent metal cation (Fe/Co/Zn/Cd) transporter
VGRETFVDVHVLVASDLSLVEAHQVSMKVEEAIQTSCGYPVTVMVHVEPDTPELADHHDDRGP